jgi:hypothetical protein
MPDESIESLKKQIGVLEQKLALYEKDPSKRGYFSLQRMVNQQIDLMNEFNLRKEVDTDPKDSKKYDRVKGIWEGLKEMLIDLKTLKAEMRISSSDDIDDGVPFIERVAETRK